VFAGRAQGTEVDAAATNSSPATSTWRGPPGSAGQLVRQLLVVEVAERSGTAMAATSA